METAGIVCEYNPFHMGHILHIRETKAALGGDAFIVCVMSGNYVQRGDFAVFNKHARAKAAVLCGADLVIELPASSALLAARDFAKAAICLLDSFGVCGHISFGSESGNLDELCHAAQLIVTGAADTLIKEGLDMGLPYASAQQRAADKLLGTYSVIFKSPNNTLGIEYIKALEELKSSMHPLTIKRTGGEHDSDTGYSASALRRVLAAGCIPSGQTPDAALIAYMEEKAAGRGPVLLKNAEQAIMSRIRAAGDFNDIPGASDGLGGRFARYASDAPTVSILLKQVKTKRFAMSRIRRVMMCAVLGITNDDAKKTPLYIRVLAMNKRGMKILKAAENRTKLPVITKPAAIYKLGSRAVEQFTGESRATDFYALIYTGADERTGGGDWRRSPVVIR